MYRYRERFTPVDSPSADSHLLVQDWQTIMTSCPLLERLALAGGFRLTPLHAEQFAYDRTPRLYDLDLSRLQGLYSSRLNMVHLVDVMLQFPRLQRLTMQSTDHLYSLYLALPRHFSIPITYLDVSGSRLSDEFLGQLSIMTPFLETLIMRGQ